jgi:hypothetical protein
MNRLILVCTIVCSIGSTPVNGQIEASSHGGTIRKFVVPPGGPGSSYAKAVVITASDDTSGIGSEYRYLSAHFPGSKPINHGREFYTKRTYDIITFTTPDSQKRALYFEYHIHRQ